MESPKVYKVYKVRGDKMRPAGHIVNNQNEIVKIIIYPPNKQNRFGIKLRKSGEIGSFYLAESQYMNEPDSGYLWDRLNRGETIWI